MKPAVRGDGNIFGALRCEYRVEMGGYRDLRLALYITERGQYVACAIERCIPTETAQLLRQPGRPPFFEKSGSGDSAQRNMLLVHPLAFFYKPALCLNERGRFSQLRHSTRTRREPARQVEQRFGLGGHEFETSE